MATKKFSAFFSDKSFEVPLFQRDYAWDTNNIDDLLDDIKEAISLGDSHYLGAFILSAGENGSDRVSVVDGQQRLTTLTILLNAMVRTLSDGDVKSFYRSKLLVDPVHGVKFLLHEHSRKFFEELLAGANPPPTSEGEKRLKAAHEWIHECVQVFKQSGNPSIETWLQNIEKMEVLEFLEPDPGKAIRMFQSVNDRGVRLSNMDIAKSLLIYYSNRFLKRELDLFIANKFGEAFRDYSSIKELAAEDGYKIRLIDRKTFTEDEIFRYHYFAYRTDRHDKSVVFDYNATADTVLEVFLKRTLKKLRNDPAKLKALIEDYVTDLSGFFSTLKTLIEKTREDKGLYLLLVVGDLAATLYPLTIRLAMGDSLRKPIPSAGDRTLLQMIEIVDLRVFKLRGTNPKADILFLTRQATEKTGPEIADSLRWFVNKFMDDGLFEWRLSKEQLYNNPGLVRILCGVEEKRRNSELSMTDLIGLVRAGQTVEHILSQKPSYGIETFGFNTMEDYSEHIDQIGNLTLLESKLNNLCNNRPVDDKVRFEKLYRASDYKMTKELAAIGAARTPAFSRETIDDRGKELAKFCVEEWPLW